MFSWEAKTPTTQAGSNLLAAHAEAAPGTNQASTSNATAGKQYGYFAEKQNTKVTNMHKQAKDV